MKKLTYLIAIATSVLAMVSCQKEQNVTNSDDLTVVSFSTSEIQTKTTFGDKTDEGKYPTLWTGDEKVGVAYNGGSVNKENITSSTDGKSASFEIAFAQDANAMSHNFYVISPADAFLGMNKDGAKGNIQINASQTPGEGTCDPAHRSLLLVTNQRHLTLRSILLFHTLQLTVICQSFCRKRLAPYQTYL